MQHTAAHQYATLACLRRCTYKAEHKSQKEDAPRSWQQLQLRSSDGAAREESDRETLWCGWSGAGSLVIYCSPLGWKVLGRLLVHPRRDLHGVSGWSGWTGLLAGPLQVRLSRDRPLKKIPLFCASLIWLIEGLSLQNANMKSEFENCVVRGKLKTSVFFWGQATGVGVNWPPRSSPQSHSKCACKIKDPLFCALTPKGPLSLRGTNGILDRYLRAEILLWFF